MHHKKLHELAKFASGLVAADLIWLLWSAHQGLFPLEFLGIIFTESILIPAIIFDVILLCILVHYSWNIGSIPTLRGRNYLRITGVLLGIVAFAHLARVFVGAEVTIAGWEVPLWLSWLGTAVTAYLSYMSFHLATHMKK